MSIESDLNRIATSLEELVKIGRAQPVQPAGKKVTPAAPPAPTAPPSDPLTGEPIAQPTQEDVHQALQKYMAKNGVDPVKSLMIKHGANKTKPTITSVPPENFAALIKEAKEGS